MNGYNILRYLKKFFKFDDCFIVGSYLFNNGSHNDIDIIVVSKISYNKEYVRTISNYLSKIMLENISIKVSPFFHLVDNQEQPLPYFDLNTNTLHNPGQCIYSFSLIPETGKLKRILKKSYEI